MNLQIEPKGHYFEEITVFLNSTQIFQELMFVFIETVDLTIKWWDQIIHTIRSYDCMMHDDIILVVDTK
jgi:hypothetical protein